MSDTGLQVPQWVRKEVRPEEHYGRFVVEPLERGYGTTIGNPMRRVLLSALEGAAIVAVKIKGVEHEFGAIKGVKEDVSEIILNLKMVNVRLHGEEDTKLVTFAAKGAKKVTAGKLLADSEEVEVINKNQHVMTLNKEASVEMELKIGRGRGYVPAESNKFEEMSIGTIPIDSLFSPVRKVNFRVEDARVGQRTDYDRLILDVWTNGCMDPEEAVNAAGRILIDHMGVFVDMEQEPEKVSEGQVKEEKELVTKLNRNVDELELSVRSANCLKTAGIRLIADLVQKSEAEMLKYHNFGKKSLLEIQNILQGMGLEFNMEIPESVLDRVVYEEEDEEEEPE